MTATKYGTWFFDLRTGVRQMLPTHRKGK